MSAISDKPGVAIFSFLLQEVERFYFFKIKNNKTLQLSQLLNTPTSQHPFTRHRRAKFRGDDIVIMVSGDDIVTMVSSNDGAYCAAGTANIGSGSATVAFK